MGYKVHVDSKYFKTVQLHVNLLQRPVKYFDNPIISASVCCC